jgi:hypothetical protein
LPADACGPVEGAVRGGADAAERRAIPGEALMAIVIRALVMLAILVPHGLARQPRAGIEIAAIGVAAVIAGWLAAVLVTGRSSDEE